MTPHYKPLIAVTSVKCDLTRRLITLTALDFQMEFQYHEKHQWKDKIFYTMFEKISNISTILVKSTVI